jgi:hypothetical protein
MTNYGHRQTSATKAKIRAAALRPHRVAALAEIFRRVGKRAGRKTAESNRAKRVPITLAGSPRRICEG